jgi:hypothetical protein
VKTKVGTVFAEGALIVGVEGKAGGATIVEGAVCVGVVGCPFVEGAVNVGLVGIVGNPFDAGAAPGTVGKKSPMAGVGAGVVEPGGGGVVKSNVGTVFVEGAAWFGDKAGAVSVGLFGMVGGTLDGAVNVGLVGDVGGTPFVGGLNVGLVGSPFDDDEGAVAPGTVGKKSPMVGVGIDVPPVG